MLASFGSAPLVEQERRDVEVAVDDRLDDRRRSCRRADTRLTSAPPSTSARTAPMWPSRAAKCSAVMPPIDAWRRTRGPARRGSVDACSVPTARAALFASRQRIAVGVDQHARQRHHLGRRRCGSAPRASSSVMIAASPLRAAANISAVWPLVVSTALTSAPRVDEQLDAPRRCPRRRPIISTVVPLPLASRASAPASSSSCDHAPRCRCARP